MKWITAVDLNKWADTKDAQQYLPELVEKLIYNSVKDIKSFKKLRVPIGDKTYLRGFDVDVDSRESIYLVGSGHSVWEIGTSVDPEEKAEEDFKKRRINTDIDKANTSYVFVTPRSWAKVQIWADKKRNLGIWKNVCVFSDVELEQWLENCPAAALWLAERLKCATPSKICELDTFWNRWSTNGILQIPLNMLVGGREEQIAALSDCFHTPSVKTLSAVSKNEALAFSVAACLSSDEKDLLLSRTVVVTSDDMMKVAIETYEGLIIIADVNKRDYGYALTKNHSIIYVTGPDEKISATNLINLPRISRDAFIKGLMSMGKSEIDSRIMMRGSMRDISVMRRRLKFDLTIPSWVKRSDVQQCCAMMLLGKWNENWPKDKDIVRIMSGDEKRFFAEANKLRIIDDAPIVNVCGKWRVKSDYDVFSVLGRFITTDMLDQYKIVILQCLNDLDPKAIEKARATELLFWKEERQYSMRLKEGLLHSAILIALYGEFFEMPANYNQGWINSLVTELLEKADLQWWISNKNLIPLIAEASPSSFLKALKTRLKVNDSDLKAVFEIGSGNIFGSGIQYSEILWALESLAWDENYLRDVTEILLQLCDYKTPDNYANKPANSLEEIYKVWYPQTNATPDVKKRIFNALAKKYSRKMFELCYKLTNGKRYDITQPTAHFKLRYIDTNHDIKNILLEDVDDAEQFLIDCMLQICDVSEPEIEKLIDIATNTFKIPIEIRTKIIKYINSIKEKIQGNNPICDNIRKSLMFNKSLSQTEKKLSKGEVDNLRGILAYIEPKDIKEKSKWIFSSLASRMLSFGDRDWRKHNDNLVKQRADILKQLTLEEIFLYSMEVEDPSTVGEAYFSIASLPSDFTDVIRAWNIGKVDERFATQYISEWRRNKHIESLIDEIMKIKDVYTHETIQALLVCSGFSEAINIVDTLPEHSQKEFWANVNVYCINKDDTLYGLEKMIKYGCFCNAISMSYLRKDDLVIPSPILIQIINGFLATDYIRNDMELIFSSVLECIDQRCDVNVNTKYQYELLLYEIIMKYPHKEKYALEKAMEYDYEFMYSLISFIYKADETNNIPNKEIFQKNISKILEFDTPACPFFKEGDVDAAQLKNYVDGMRLLGKKDGILDAVDIFIGKLLARSVGINSIPTAVCDIIDRIDSEKLNNSLRIKLFNLNGLTVRRPYEGGTIERSKNDRFKKIADDIRIEYPVAASIFDNLCRQYNRDALQKDVHAELTDIEY